ncbi:hypothetical protein [Marinilactibacillus kalidii]|uniref:hypothetical protein n=1 Tax=Marinilactibacillus kalidii TaxID=2820274 RepID=UPI001ABE4B9D|nr:hypothetical protein [Marinilactibacillus kalidii]
MTSPTITLMDAYMIERLLSKGISKESLIQSIYAHTLNQYQSEEDSYDYAALDTAVQGKESLYEAAITDGYVVSYLTINGLKNLLEIKFGFQASRDYTLQDAKLEKLVVTRAQFDAITLLVGRVWTVQLTSEPSSDTMEITIQHVSLV